MYKKILAISFILFSLIATSLEANHNREYEGETLHWSEYSVRSETRQKISALPSEVVQNLPIPILFGVEIKNLTKNFGDPRGDGTRTHEGLDMLAPTGTPIIAPTDAVVTRIGDGVNSGLYVYTADPGGEVFVYMHLDRIGEGVSEGLSLKRGDLIGYVGNTGNASGGAAHLHFEIKNNGATDPFPRLTQTFSLNEKIQSLATIISVQNNPQVFSQFIVDNFIDELRKAETQNITLPQEIKTLLENAPQPTSVVTPPSSNTPSYTDDVVSFDMELGAQGSHVVWLQKFLIEKDTGEDARYLGRSGATGYFGPITQRALIEYQKANNISPAVGYFGQLTRASIANDVPSTEAPQTNTEVKASFNFTRNMSVGARGEDVRDLQIFLNTNGVIVTDVGAGSPGNETNYFGTLTQKALAEYQRINEINPPAGYFGPITRLFINK